MRRTATLSTMVALGALALPGAAAAKQAPPAPLTVEILDHAKLDKRTGVAQVRVEVRCAPFPGGYRTLFAELNGGQAHTAGVGSLSGQIVCDGRKRVYTTDSFKPGVFGDPGPPWVRGPLDVNIQLLLTSTDGEINRGAYDAETIRLH